MSDINGDGKQDWHDDYILNEIIPDKSGGSSGSGRKGSSSSGSGNGCFITLVVAVIVLILKLLGFE